MKNSKKTQQAKKSEKEEKKETEEEDAVVDKSQFPPSLADERKTLFSKIRNLYLEIKKANLQRNNTQITYASGEEFKLFEEWLPVYIEKTEVDLHYGDYHSQLKKYVFLRQQAEAEESNAQNETEKVIMKFFEFFKGDWPVRISGAAIFNHQF